MVNLHEICPECKIFLLYRCYAYNTCKFPPPDRLFFCCTVMSRFSFSCLFSRHSSDFSLVCRVSQSESTPELEGCPAPLEPPQSLFGFCWTTVEIEVATSTTMHEFGWALVKIGEWAGASSIRASACLFLRQETSPSGETCGPHQSSMNRRMRPLQLPCLD